MANILVSRDRGLVAIDWTGAGQAARLWGLAFLLFAEGAKDLRRVDLVLAGYRRHVHLERDELLRLSALMRARPMALQVWRFYMGQKSIAEVAQAVTAAGELSEAIADRARDAFVPRRAR